MDFSCIFLYQAAPQFCTSPFDAIRFHTPSFRCTVTLRSAQWYPGCRAAEALIGPVAAPSSGPSAPCFTTPIPGGSAPVATIRAGPDRVVATASTGRPPHGAERLNRDALTRRDVLNNPSSTLDQ